MMRIESHKEFIGKLERDEQSGCIACRDLAFYLFWQAALAASQELPQRQRGFDPLSPS
jgi:hypothetical protein